MRPAGRIALRSLSDMPMVLPPRPDILSSSPTVDCNSREGEDPAPVAPSNCVDSSETLVTRLPAGRSHQSLLTIPLKAGVAPERIVECPTEVTVGVAS